MTLKTAGAFSLGLLLLVGADAGAQTAANAAATANAK
jgi:hypothetical protein